MKAKQYCTMQEVKDDLKILKLRRNISLAELEGSKTEMEESLRPIKLLAYAANTLKKYGTLFLLRKLLK